MVEADIIAALVAALKLDSNVASVVGTDVYGDELPKPAVERMPIAAIVVQASGGSSLTEESNAELDAQRIDIMAYGQTPAIANKVRRAAASALRHIERRVVQDLSGAKTLIHWVNKAGGFYAARERDGLWPQSFQSFQVLYSTQEILP